MKSIPSLLIALVLCGCSPVYVSKPIGEKPKDLIHEVAEWEGTWINSKGEAFLVKVEDPVKGMLQVATIEEKEKGVEFRKYTIYLRDSGEWCFASFRLEEAEEKKLYFWAKISKDDRQVILWAPDVSKFKALVEKGQLPGKIEKGDVFLGDLEPKHMELITSSSNGVLLEWESPMVLTKTSK